MVARSLDLAVIRFGALTARVKTPAVSEGLVASRSESLSFPKK